MIVSIDTTTRFGKYTRLSAGTITLGEITSLDHKLLDDTVECRSLITVTLRTNSQSSKVLGGFWDRLSIKTHNNTADFLIAMLDTVED